MTDEEYRNRMRFAKRLLEEEITPETALRDLVCAGIFDWDGNYTSNYPALREWQQKMKNNNLK
jgi:antitoxin component HigA of HigAB toxin-antitoxin module